MKIRISSHGKKTLKRIIHSSLFVLMASFLVFNIIFSQKVPALYSSFIEGDMQTAAAYLKKIRALPFFHTELSLYKAKFGNTLEQEVFDIEWKREERIKELTKELTKNNEAADVLYGLQKLYQDAGNTEKAEEYLRKAREIDPNRL